MESLIMLCCQKWRKASVHKSRCFSYTNFEGGQHMVILIIADGLIIFIYVDAYMEPEMETEVCGWPLQ